VDKLPAGVVTNLCQQILDVSGFNSPQTAKKILDQKREDAAQVRSLMKAFVLTTIKGYTPENLDDMTYSQLAERVALSEKIIEITQALHSIEPNNLKLQLIDPKEEEKKAKIKAAKYNMAKPHGAADYEDPIAQKLWGIKK
jgi:aminoglycoside phosphotransferase (APT) family kinase protein